MIDLHTHTKYSDGADSVMELLRNAESKNLNIISITDHNTASAYDELEKMNYKQYYTGKIIPGIELNTKVLGVPIEILGYGIDYEKMNEMLKDVYIPAEERNKIEVKRLYDRCIKAGIRLEEDCLKNFEGTSFASKFIQTEIKKHLENKKIITEDAWDDTKVFYRKYMSNPEGILYVEMDDFVPDFNVASDLVKKAGGLVFLPHIYEYRENSERILAYILENYKIDGIECFYTTFSDEQKERLVKLCSDKHIYMSGGSDYHGKNKPNVDIGVGFGNLKVEDSIINDWIEKIKMLH